MKTLLRHNKDLGIWENIYSYPLSPAEAAKALSQQKRWAKEDETEADFRIADVKLTMEET